MEIFATDIDEEGIPNAALDYPTIALDERYWFIILTNRDMFEVRNELLSKGSPGNFTMYGVKPFPGCTIVTNQFLITSNDSSFKEWMINNYPVRENAL